VCVYVCIVCGACQCCPVCRTVISFSSVQPLTSVLKFDSILHWHWAALVTVRKRVTGDVIAIREVISTICVRAIVQ